MRRRAAALVEFGLVAGILIMLMTSVGALYPAIATKTTVTDATLAAGLALSTYHAPDATDPESTSLRSLGAQRAILCKNAALVTHRMLVASGLPLPTAAPAGCGPASANRPLGIELRGLALDPDGEPASPFTLCVTYRYAPEGGISYFLASGPTAIDAENLTYIDLAACAAVFIDNGLETP